MNRRRFIAGAGAGIATASTIQIGPARGATATTFIVVSGASSKIIRRIVFPDSDDELSSIKARLLPGEKATELILSDYPVRNVDALQSVIGTPRGSGKAVLVDKVTGDVVDVVMADSDVTPEIGNKTVVESDEAGPGWKLEGGKLVDKRPKGPG